MPPKIESIVAGVVGRVDPPVWDGRGRKLSCRRPKGHHSRQDVYSIASAMELDALLNEPRRDRWAAAVLASLSFFDYALALRSHLLCESHPRTSLAKQPKGAGSDAYWAWVGRRQAACEADAVFGRWQRKEYAWRNHQGVSFLMETATGHLARIASAGRLGWRERGGAILDAGFDLFRSMVTAAREDWFRRFDVASIRRPLWVDPRSYDEYRSLDPRPVDRYCLKDWY